MAVSVSKDASFSSGAISFSALRSKFKNATSGSLSLSSLKRQTSLSLTSPTVPDATENSNIPTTNSNIQLSGYRGSITRYDLYQTGTDTNFDIDAQSWNSNLGKNVPKIFYVNGTLGATSISNYAASFNAAAFNLSIIINGLIEGAGGAGGTPSSPNGENGGNALYVNSNTNLGSTSTRKIKLYNTNRIYAGGGGGGVGPTGGTGGRGGQAVSGQTGGIGGTGGAGGNGGRGRGYNQTRTYGAPGSPGSDGGNGSDGGGDSGDGGYGGTGGNGGDWGKPGREGNVSSPGVRGSNAVYGLYYYSFSNSTTTFTAVREAARQSTIVIPGIANFTVNSDDGTEISSYNLSAGFYGVITAFENNPPFTPPSGNGWVDINIIGTDEIGLDDSRQDDPDGDYNDLILTKTSGSGQFGNYSPPGLPGPSRPTNYGLGGSAGTKILGENYIIMS